MMKWLDAPKRLFGVLRVASVAAMAAGVGLGLCGDVIPFFQGAEYAPGMGYAVTTLMLCLLWCMAWGSFLGMCTRLMKDGTAFTAENSGTLRVIGLSVAAMAAVMLLRALPGLIAAPDVYRLLEAVVLPGVFLTVSMLAFILSRLLDHAMTLEEEQADVV